MTPARGMPTGTEKFTSRLGSTPAFTTTPFSQGDPRQDREDALNRDLQLHKAHVVMLAEQSIISVETAKAILAELLELERLGIEAISFDSSLGLYLSTEKYLVDRLSADVAGRMHTARSRNDLEPANSRLYVRDKINQIVQALVGLKSALLLRATEHVETVMPGYTHHSQHAQPITFAHFSNEFSPDCPGRWKKAALEIAFLTTLSGGILWLLAAIQEFGPVGILGFDLPGVGAVEAAAVSASGGGRE